MTTFVRATEVWVPTSDGRELTLGSGAYGTLDDFAAVSASTRFRYGEGLPGRAWSTRGPVILRALEGSYFRRTHAALDAGLSTAVAMPIFAGDRLTSVVVFFCGADPSLVGAIEVFRASDDDGAHLELDEGYYGSASSFERLSRTTTFRPWHGLPGIVWASELPQLFPDLGRTPAFLRAASAVRAGLECGLGIPCSGPDSGASVVTFLSGFDTPIAHRFEIWLPSEDASTLTFHRGTCDRDVELEARLAGTTIARGEGPIGTPLVTCVPAISRDLAREEDPVSKGAARFELEHVVALPILDDGVLRAVVAMYA